MEYEHLVDKEALAKAREMLDSAIFRHVQSMKMREAAEKALAAARRVADTAANNTFSGKHADFERAVADREIELRAAIRVEGAAASQRKYVEDRDYRTAEGVAYGPVVIEGARRKLEATLKAEQARQALAESEKQYAEGRQMVRKAVSMGFWLHFHGEYDSDHRMLSSAEEKAALEKMGIDLEAGTHSFKPTYFTVGPK